MTRHPYERIAELARANPLLLGALVVGAGVGLGVSLPSTRREDTLLGSSKKRLLERARFFYDDVQESTREAVDTQER